MGYYVSSLVLLQSSKCSYAFSCLKTGECASPGQCQGAEAHGSMLLLKNKEALPSCPYRLEVGASQFCTCPTFVALHRQKQDMRNEASYLKRKLARNTS
jgi:hypothetical protein